MMSQLLAFFALFALTLASPNNYEPDYYIDGVNDYQPDYYIDGVNHYDVQESDVFPPAPENYDDSSFFLEPPDDEFLEPPDDEFLEPPDDDFLEPPDDEFLEPPDDEFLEPPDDEFLEPPDDELMPPPDFGEFIPPPEFTDDFEFLPSEIDSFLGKKGGKKGGKGGKGDKVYNLDSRTTTTKTEKDMFWRWITNRLKKSFPDNHATKLAWEDAQTVVAIGMYYEMTGGDAKVLELMKQQCDILLKKRESRKLFIENEVVLTWPTYDKSEKSSNGKAIWFMNMKMTSQLLAPFAYFSFLVSESSSSIQNQYKNTALQYLDMVFDRMDWYYKSKWYHPNKDFWVFPDYPNYTKVDQFKENTDWANTPLMYNSWFITSGQMDWARRAALNFGVHTSEAKKFEKTIQSCLDFFISECIYEKKHDAYRWVYVWIKGEKKWEDPGHGGIDIFGLVRLYNNGNNPYGLTKGTMQRFANTYKNVLYKGRGWKFYCDLGFNSECGSDGKRPEEKSVGWSPLAVVDGQVMDIMYDNLLGPNKDGMSQGPALYLMWASYYKWVETGGKFFGDIY